MRRSRAERRSREERDRECPARSRPGPPRQCSRPQGSRRRGRASAGGKCAPLHGAPAPLLTGPPDPSEELHGLPPPVGGGLVLRWTVGDRRLSAPVDAGLQRVRIAPLPTELLLESADLGPQGSGLPLERRDDVVSQLQVLTVGPLLPLRRPSEPFSAGSVGEPVHGHRGRLPNELAAHPGQTSRGGHPCAAPTFRTLRREPPGPPQSLAGQRPVVEFGMGPAQAGLVHRQDPHGPAHRPTSSSAVRRVAIRARHAAMCSASREISHPLVMAMSLPRILATSSCPSAYRRRSNSWKRRTPSIDRTRPRRLARRRAASASVSHASVRASASMSNRPRYNRYRASPSSWGSVLKDGHRDGGSADQLVIEVPLEPAERVVSLQGSPSPTAART